MKISSAIGEVEKSVGPVVKILATVGVGALLLGVIAGLTSTITVPSAIATYLNSTLITAVTTVFGSMTTALVTVISLIVVIVLWIVFGLGKKGKSGSVM
jgi:small basic protein